MTPVRTSIVSGERTAFLAFSDNPTSARERSLLAEDKLRAAAASSTRRARAETNTRRMLTALYRSASSASPSGSGRFRPSDGAVPRNRPPHGPQAERAALTAAAASAAAWARRAATSRGAKP